MTGYDKYEGMWCSGLLRYVYRFEVGGGVVEEEEEEEEVEEVEEEELNIKGKGE